MTLARCQLDATLKTLDADVVACHPVEGGHLVRLSETILYATGGGQPHDLGLVGGRAVLDVTRDPEGHTLHKLDGPVSGRVLIEIDWARRFDHMQQHTAQHLITALAADRLGWATTSFHLGPETCTIDLDTQDTPEAALRDLEDAVNAEIRAARPVRVRVVDPADLPGLDVRTRGLPENFTGQLRLVEIEGLDLNTCGGTHVASTAELQAVKLRGTSRIRSDTRLAFIAGQRALDHLTRALDRERALTRLLGAGPEDHAGLVEKLQLEARNAARQLGALHAEIARQLGAQLAQTDAPAALFHRPCADAKFLADVAVALEALRPDLLVLLTTSERDEGPGLFLIVGPPGKVAAAGPPVASLLQGRGGGRPGRYQGKAEAISLRDDAFSLLLQIARS